jgi:hypothetical protein
MDLLLQDLRLALGAEPARAAAARTIPPLIEKPFQALRGALGGGERRVAWPELSARIKQQVDELRSGLQAAADAVAALEDGAGFAQFDGHRR